MMDKYKVKLADKEIIVFANSHNNAIKKAIAKAENFSITTLSTCLKDGDHEDEEMLYHFEYLKNNGFLKGYDIVRPN